MGNLVKINCYTVLRCILLAGIVNVAAVEDNPSPDIQFAKQDSSATPDFQKHVIQYFADEYKAGRTPNPCVMCNEHLKFGRLIDRANQLGADYIATGHFARVEKDESTGRHLLYRGHDDRKDQTFFLFSLLSLLFSSLVFSENNIKEKKRK